MNEALARDLDEAFGDVVRSLQDRLFSTALQLTGNHHDAEEMSQEAFIRVYRALSGFGSERIRELHLEAYLWTTLINLCRNRARRARRHPLSSLTTDVEGQENGTAGVEASQVWRPRLALLPERQRLAVLLRHVAGLSYGEIAETLTVPVGTAKADVHRGLARLRSMIQAEGEVA